MTAIKQYVSVTIQIIKLAAQYLKSCSGVELITLYKTVLTPVEEGGGVSLRYIHDGRYILMM